ncbi:protein of unknown function [Acidithiobacillus ferrivorans]|uniref:Uncharacterized protein n=1 Tax=Acidithiobacillus ferrivorans TaxID=160808 RepID=A0A060UT77_9PROT|nr:hypothetical protein AFERRI_30435 [Acidithiobacillus ferrivorans]SMH66398.1 protein of unknown function [Acidithiobacillus ferrivorans]
MGGFANTVRLKVRHRCTMKIRLMLLMVAPPWRVQKNNETSNKVLAASALRGGLLICSFRNS